MRASAYENTIEPTVMEVLFQKMMNKEGLIVQCFYWNDMLINLVIPEVSYVALLILLFLLSSTGNRRGTVGLSLPPRI